MENTINDFKKLYNDVEQTTHLDGYLTVLKFTAKNNPVMVVFRGRSKKPIVKNAYSSIERREEVLEMLLKETAKNLEFKNKKADIKVGDVLYTSWGWEQTNIDFYVVTKLIGNCTVEYSPIGSKIVRETGPFSCNVKPDLSKKTDIKFKGRINSHGVYVDNIRGTAIKVVVNREYHSSWGA